MRQLKRIITFLFQMKMKSLLRFLTLATLVAACAPAATLSDLRCEYLQNPLGMDVGRPRLSWKVMEEHGEPDIRGWQQTAYQVLVASSDELLEKDTGDLWDSGKVAGDRSVQVEYEGKPLATGMGCYWKARVWDQHGTPTPWSKPASWTMGLLQPDDWQAQWIGLDAKDATADPKDPEKRRLPARYLRREFVAAGNVKRATASICGLGFFDLFINGGKVGDHVMDPVLTEYHKRACYVTFDVTRNLTKGGNAVGVILGNGRFFAPRIKKPADFKDYGAPRLLARIDVEYDDGTRAAWLSDGQWRATADGPITANNEYDGRKCRGGTGRDSMTPNGARWTCSMDHPGNWPPR